MNREQTLAHIADCIHQMEVLDRRRIKSWDVAQQMDGLNRMLLEDYIRLTQVDGQADSTGAGP